MLRRYYLSDLRAKHNYTYEELSFYSGISMNHCILIEQGKRGVRMSLVIAKKLADAYKLSLDEFYEYESRYLLKHQQKQT